MFLYVDAARRYEAKKQILSLDDYYIKRVGRRRDDMTERGHIAPLTLPKEQISAQLDGKFLLNIKILEPSDHRMKPPCAHFKSCRDAHYNMYQPPS